ncbi:class I SAM-dependent methyltransferase [Clostridium sp. C2-6-12]|uniref:class I SAM-dependent methyltransferase n=1 Tax=Clostridium sp. C2-6-12 TaxID=2698832 RepID=UPI0013696AF7|nr:class I SAM-dependent methyltransferase [Clostridium sp. C2-6-12]
MEIKKLIPAPEIRNWTGPFDDEEYYFNLGKEQSEKIIQWLSIKPDQKILDIGCGCGRIAIHFLNYLNEQGQYIGIDSNKNLLSYCIDNIPVTNNNFKFKFIDAYNGAYSKEGKIKCQDIVFPIEDESVDIVIMWSVFTHMYLEDIDSYLKEIHRVLKKGGLFISSFNLYNKYISNQIKMGKAYLDIKYKINENSYCLVQETPEYGFAHNEEMVKELYWKNELLISEIKYGIWSSKELTGEFHDCVIAQK